MSKVRDGYKMTELGEIPEEWNVTELSNVTDIIMGQSPDSASYNEEGQGIPFFQGKTEFGKLNPSIKKWCTQPTKIAEPLDVLISVRAPVGDVNINIIRSCIGRGLGAIRQTNMSYYKYIFYILQIYQGKLKKSSQGSTFEAINSTDLRQLKIPLPTVMEQKKIALILSSIDEQIENTDNLIEKTKELKKGLMQRLLTKGIWHDRFKDTEVGRIPEDWEVKRLDEICENITIGLVKTMTKYYVEQGVPLIRNSDIKENKILKSNMVFLDEDFALDNADKKLKKGDIVTVHTGDIGTSAIIDEELNGSHGFATLNTTVNKNIINNEYLCWYFNSDIFKQQAYSFSTGDGRNNLNLKDFINSLIILPRNIDEQVRIASILSGVSQQIDQYKSKKLKLQEVKIGLMKKLLTGKIRVKI